MMIARRIIASGLVVCLLLWPWWDVVHATVAAGAVTDRNVFSFTSAGATKMINAEKAVAKAVRLLGILGKLAGPVGVAFVVYDIASNTWDWWSQDYDALVGGESTLGAGGSWGNTSGVGSGVVGTVAYYMGSVLKCGTTYLSGAVVIGIRWTNYTTTVYCNGQQYNSKVEVWGVETATLPQAAVGSATGGTDRQTLVGKIDQAIGEIRAQQAIQTVDQQGASSDLAQSLIDTLNAGRSVVSNGVGLSSGDYTQSGGWSAGDTAAPGNAKPGTIAEGAASESPSIDLSPVTSAVSAVAAAVAASQAAVVSAVDAVASAVSAASSAIVSAVSASQAAIVSAVQGIAAPIVAEISAAKVAIVAAIQAQAGGGGSEGTTTAVEGLRADEAARDTAASTAAAGSVAPAAACPECAREEKWQELWDTLKTAAMAAPVFGLISKLVINPGGGGAGLCDTVSISTSMAGTLTLNGAAWSCSTILTVFRFAIIGTGFIVGYMIVFG